MNVLLNPFHLLRTEISDLIAVVLKINFCGWAYLSPYLKAVLTGRSRAKDAWIVGPVLTEPGVPFVSHCQVSWTLTSGLSLSAQPGQQVDFSSMIFVGFQVKELVRWVPGMINILGQNWAEPQEELNGSSVCTLPFPSSSPSTQDCSGCRVGTGGHGRDRPGLQEISRQTSQQVLKVFHS